MSKLKTPPGFRTISHPNGPLLNPIHYTVVGDEMVMVIPHGMSVSPRYVEFYWEEFATYDEMLKRLDAAKLERPPCFALSTHGKETAPEGMGILPDDYDAHDLAWLSCFMAETQTPLVMGILVAAKAGPFLQGLPGESEIHRVNLDHLDHLDAPNTPSTATEQ